jgi:hypothetical protein
LGYGFLLDMETDFRIHLDTFHVICDHFIVLFWILIFVAYVWIRLGTFAYVWIRWDTLGYVWIRLDIFFCMDVLDAAPQPH